MTFSASVLEAIHIGTLDSTGGIGPDVKLAASDPTFAVTADGMLQTLTVKVDMGALDVLGDWDPMSVASPNRDLRVQVGGLYGQATFTEASDDVRRDRRRDRRHHASMRTARASSTSG